MTSKSVAITSATGIYGRARGHLGDATSGEPRIVIDTADGLRIYATFSGKGYADAPLHYRAFVGDSARSMDRKSIMSLAGSLLSILPTEERTTVIANVCDRYHTPDVQVNGEEVSIAS